MFFISKLFLCISDNLHSQLFPMLQIICTLSDGSGGKSYNTSTDATSYLIESLAIDTVYLCTVRALLNSGGYGESSDSVTVTTSQVTIKPTGVATRSSSSVTATSPLGKVYRIE